MKKSLALAVVVLFSMPGIAQHSTGILPGKRPGTGNLSRPFTLPQTFNTSTPNNSLGGGGGELPDALRAITFVGANGSGTVVAGGGNVNGDGFDDLIVANLFDDAAGTNSGKVEIFFGGSVINTVPDIVITGDTAGAGLGISAEFAGDVNGDGFGDVIVGAVRLTDNDMGRVFIYFGGPVMDSSPDVVLTSPEFEGFGARVAGAGDVNGDSFADVIVGFGTDSPTGNVAQLYLGGSSMDGTVDVSIPGIVRDPSVVAAAGDINGDGFGDVIVGLSDYSGGLHTALICYGGAVMDGNPDVTLTDPGVTFASGFGSYIASSDWNGDGYSDLALGTRGPSLYFYYGGPTIDNTPDLTLPIYGYQMAVVGDINGDGFEDLLVGNPELPSPTGGIGAGRAFLYLCGPVVDAFPDQVFVGETGMRLGRSVAGAGDVNGDGYPDVLIGAPHDFGLPPDTPGKAFLYLSSLTGTDIADGFFTGESAGDYFGLSVASAGDVNGDGYYDVIVGAPSNDAAGADAGRAYIYFSGSGMDDDPNVVLNGMAAGDRFGWSVSSAGDVNNDGYDDVIVGAPYSGAQYPEAGMAMIFYGGEDMDSVADKVFIGTFPFDHFGKSVAWAGDVNGDGFADVLVGAPDTDFPESDGGSAFLYHGATDMSFGPALVFTGVVAGDALGQSVSRAGDVNRDGYDDVIVGVPFNDGGGTNAGQAYIYMGGPFMDDDVDVTITGAATDDNLGYSVSTAGDVNGDHFDDVIVGSYRNDAGGMDAGRAGVYYGGIAMDATADVTFTGTGASDLFGGSVSSAGDVNRDGFVDVIIGALGVDAMGANRGRAYVYFGGWSMDAVVDIILDGEAPGDYFGCSVAWAGDVNADGAVDIIVGAFANDAGGTDAGRAYLYTSSAPPVIPRITAVRDIPFDQGGRVGVQWMRSAYDEIGINRVTEYLVQRSNPPGANGYAWETMAVVQASHEPQYAYSAQTPSDSMMNNSGTYHFRVTARTQNPNEYWRSNIVSGHSVDNLAPEAIPNLNVEVLTENVVRLNWPLNRSDADLSTYVVYRSTTSGFVPSAFNMIGTTVDTTFIDSSPPIIQTAFYRVRARDIHGNEGGPSPEASNGTLINQQYSVNANWNLVSVPMSVSDYTKTSLFPTATSDAFSYTGSYVSQSALQNGPGYWLKFPSSQTIDMVGYSRSTESIPVTQGWNLVGSITDPVPVETITSSPPGIVTSQFHGFVAGTGYAAATTIAPGKAYWVKLNQTGFLILSSSGSEEANRIRIIPTSEQPPPSPDTENSNPNPQIPTVFTLERNYPNPFNPSTTIKFGIPVDAEVQLAVFDILGRKVADVINGRLNAGYHQVSFEATGLATGVYLYRMNAIAGDGNVYTNIQKMLLSK